MLQQQPVTDIEYRDAQFCISFGLMQATAPVFVIATGGPSIPKLGATGFAYDIARRFGLEIVTPRPALVPLTLGAADSDFTALRGVSSEVSARVDDVSFREAVLCTHRGLSGPAILQVSSYWTSWKERGSWISHRQRSRVGS